jgi:hemoglobin/transferrin/lactoferrin receptor protein
MPRCYSLVLLASFALALTAPGQTEEELIEQSYLITATLSDRTLFDVPYTGVVKKGLSLGVSRNFQDALRETPGVHLQRTSYGQTSPVLRGLTGYHTLALVDGIRLNNSVFRSGPNEYWGLIDPLALDRIEVVLGPSSVLYGSDAVGGSVNAIPLRRKEFGPESSWDRRLFLRFSSAENSITGRAQVSGNVGESFGFVLGGTLASLGDLDAGGDLGRQPHTGFQQGFGDVSLDFHIDDHWSVGILGQIARIDDVSRSHQTRYGVSYHGTTVGSERRRNLDWERDLAAVTLRGTDLDAFFDGIEVRVSWQRIDEGQDRIRSDGRRDLQGVQVDTFGLALRLVSETVIGRLTYGFDWYHDEVESFRKNFDATGTFTGRSIQGPVAGDARYDLLGAFVQNEVDLLDDLELIVGGRLTFADTDASEIEDLATGNPTSLSDSWLAAVGSVRLMWAPADPVRIFGGVSQGFRAPNLSDLSRLDTARTNEIEVPSPDLDPEHFVSFEVGTKVNWGGLDVQVAYHYTLIDDLIIRQPTGAMIGGDFVVEKRNGGDGHLQGIDVGLLYDIDDQWRLFGTFQWLDGQVDTYPTSMPVSQTEVSDRLTPVNGTLGVRWQTEDRKFWVRGWVVIVDEQDRLSTRDRGDTSRIPPGGTPGYTIWNLELGYAFDEKKRVFFSVENLTDKNYRLHGSGVQEPGVNVILGADITF